MNIKLNTMGGTNDFWDSYGASSFVVTKKLIVNTNGPEMDVVQSSLHSRSGLKFSIRYLIHTRLALDLGVAIRDAVY